MEVKCAKDDCQNLFIKKTHNARYCSIECRTVVTNAKILANYHAKQAIKKATGKRVCSATHCNNLLSKYNLEKHCEACKIKLLEKRLLSWGWTAEQIEEERSIWS